MGMVPGKEIGRVWERAAEQVTCRDPESSTLLPQTQETSPHRLLSQAPPGS